jgi:hypothetical protein
LFLHDHLSPKSCSAFVVQPFLRDFANKRDVEIEDDSGKLRVTLWSGAKEAHLLQERFFFGGPVRSASLWYKVNS